MKLGLLTLFLLAGCDRRPARGPTPVRLSVTTSPPTTVTIVTPADSNRPRLELGRTPLDAVSGAFVGDTVLLVNEEKGIRFEEPIEFGRPDELKTIHKVFAK